MEEDEKQFLYRKWNYDYYNFIKRNKYYQRKFIGNITNQNHGNTMGISWLVNGRKPHIIILFFDYDVKTVWKILRNNQFRLYSSIVFLMSGLH